MAYDSTPTPDLEREAREWMNKSENAMQGAMRRQDEVIRRRAANDPGPVDSPDADPVPDPDAEPDAPHHPAPVAEDVLAADVPFIDTEDGVSDADYLRSAAIPPTAEETGNAAMIADTSAFRLTAHPSHLSYNDPMVHPGMAGHSHLHLFLGNTAVDAFTTYETLRTTGNGTTEGSALNRSSYWLPPILVRVNGAWHVKMPADVIFYYKRPPRLDHPATAAGITELAHLPRGLRMIKRWAKWTLRGPNGATKTSSYRHPEVFALAQPGDTITCSFFFPNSWDGSRVDSADHMSHVSGIKRDTQTGLPTVKDTHPVQITQLTANIHYEIHEGEDMATAYLASETPDTRDGRNAHFDYWEGWKPRIAETWEQHIIEAHRNVSNGVLGDGTALSWRQEPDLPLHVPLADIPTDGRDYRLVPR